jgi:anthranilate phosphoribosyltransferase
LSIANLIKKIGKGPKLAKDLTRAEAQAALTAILDATAAPHQIGAFLIAARMKGETAAETAGFIAALREHSERVRTGLARLLELAPAHDGKKKVPVLAPFTAAVVAAAGVPVLMTGGQDVPTKKGVTPRMVLERLGIPTRGGSTAVALRLRDRGVAYWDVEDFSPRLAALKRLRDGLGLRTPLNTAEKAIRPTFASHLMTGVFHGPYLEELTEAMRSLGDDNVLCLQATEGSTDLHLRKRVLYRRVADGTLSEQLEIDPAGFGLKRASDPGFFDADFTEGARRDDAAGTPNDGAAGPVPDVAGLADRNVRLGLDALAGRPGLFYDALVYNAAVALWFVGEVPTIPAGLKIAQDLVTAGKPLGLLKALKE